MSTQFVPKEVLFSLQKDFLFPNTRLFAQVATQSKQGPHLRTMRLYDLNSQGQLVFLSRTDTVKWQDLQKDPGIAVCFVIPTQVQIIAEGSAQLLTKENDLEIRKYYWQQLTPEIQKIYSDNKTNFAQISQNFGVIVITPNLWDFMKLREDYTCSERIRFSQQENTWQTQN